MKIVVLGGGISTERHVALVTATSACQALRRRGHQAVFVDLFFGMENYDKPLELAFDEPDGLCGKVAIETEAPDLEAIRRSADWNPMETSAPVLLKSVRLLTASSLACMAATAKTAKYRLCWS